MSEPTDSVARILDTAWRDYLRTSRRSGTMTRTHLWASGRRDCLRRMALDLLHPEDQEEFSDDSLERFARGNEREDSVTARLIQMGPRANPPFKITEGQRRFEIKDRDGTLLISGKIDGRLLFEGRKDRPVFEVKSGMTVANVNSLEDLDRSKWTKHYLDQLLSYLLAESEPIGILVLDRPNVPAFLEVRLEEHLARAESFLVEARVAIDARMGKGPLPPFTENKALCQSCPHFGKTCAPPVDFGEGLQIITDEGLLLAAEVRAETESAAQRFDRADKELKEALRGKPQVLVGPYLVTGKWSARADYDIPKELKESYKKVNPQGTWRSDWERHGVTD